MRRAEVSAMLADTAQRTVGGQRWWQRFETDVELGGFNLSALAIAGWTIVGGIVASIAGAIIFQSLWGLLIGLAAPFVTRWYRLAPGLEDAEGVRGAARRQPRRARRRHAHRSLDHGGSQRDGRQRDRAVEDRVSPRAPGRAARRPARRCPDGDGPPHAEPGRRADRARDAPPARGRRQHGRSARPSRRGHPGPDGATATRRGADGSGPYLSLDPHRLCRSSSSSRSSSRAATISSRCSTRSSAGSRSSSEASWS